MPGPKLTPPQKARYNAGKCACGCGESRRTANTFSAYADGAAHRKRAQRERDAWVASGAQARYELQKRLDQVTFELGGLTQQIDQLSAKRAKLRELATDLQARLSPQVELPVVTPAARSPADVTGKLEQLDPSDALWRMAQSRAVKLVWAPDTGAYKLVDNDQPSGILSSEQVTALGQAGLLVVKAHIGTATLANAVPLSPAGLRHRVKLAMQRAETTNGLAL